MKIKVFNDKTTMVLKSDVQLELLKKLARTNPDALRIVDENGNPKFSACVAKCGSGRINSIGAEFAPETGEDGLAKITIDLPACESVGDYIADTYGRAITNLQAVEAQISEAVEAMGVQRAAINDMISIID